MEQESRTEYLSIRLRPLMARQVEAAAREYRMTKSDVVRWLLTAMLRRRRERHGLGDAGGDRPLPQLR